MPAYKRFFSSLCLLALGCSGSTTSSPAPGGIPASEPPPGAPAAATVADSAGATVHGGHHGDGHHGGHGHHGDGHHGGHGPHSHGGPVGHRFERADDWVQRFEGTKRDAWQEPAKVIALMDIEPGMAVADLGAGTGYFLPHLSAAVGPQGSVLALDVEADMVRYMKERIAGESLANTRARQVPYDDPVLPAGALDRVLIVNVWHHIGERTAYASKLARALKPGGAVLIVDFTMDSPEGPPREHRLQPQVVSAELAASGLVTEVRTGVLPYQYVVIGRRR